MKILERKEHPISRKNISELALNVLYRLTRKGHLAFLAGGGVRDLLIGKVPNDFDIATSAKPLTIRKAFRNSILIGRRFKLVHVIFGKKFIEVATFRKFSQYNEDRENNSYGTPEEDAFCRDFTINSLFYNIKGFTVIDFVGGLKDIEDGIVRINGEPDVRFHEDPVRILRGTRLAAQIGFDIHKDTLASMQKNVGTLAEASESRMVYEVRKTFQCGAASDSIRRMFDVGILKIVFPKLSADLSAAGKKTQEQSWSFLSSLDHVAKDQKFHPSFVLIFSCLLYPLVLKKVPEFWNHRYPLYKLCDKLKKHLNQWLGGLKINAGERTRIFEVFMVQRRFPFMSRKSFSKKRFLRCDYFRDALNLFDIYTICEKRWKSVPAVWKDARKGKLPLHQLKDEVHKQKR